MPRKGHKYHYLYKTTNMINGKYYVGMHSTSNLDDGYLGSGKRLRYSINKYGKENFKKEILSYYENREELNKAEMEMVTETIINDPLCMNLMIGGKGGNVGYSSEQYKIWASLGGIKLKEKLKDDKKLANKISIIKQNMFKKLWELGKLKHYDWTGRKHKQETIEKMRQNTIPLMGENNGSFGRCWIYNNELKENKKIKKEELKYYLSLNWIKGRKLSFK